MRQRTRRFLTDYFQGGVQVRAPLWQAVTLWGTVATVAAVSLTAAATAEPFSSASSRVLLSMLGGLAVLFSTLAPWIAADARAAQANVQLQSLKEKLAWTSSRPIRLYVFLKPFNMTNVGPTGSDFLTVSFQVISCTPHDIPVRSVVGRIDSVGGNLIQAPLDITSRTPSLPALQDVTIQGRANFTDAQLRRIEEGTQSAGRNAAIEVSLDIEREDGGDPIRCSQLLPGTLRMVP